MEQSEKRSADIKFFGLELDAPTWINPTKNDVWTHQNIEYLIKWIHHRKSDHNLTVDFIGRWNERGFDKAWHEDFHKGLYNEGLSQTQIVADE